MPYLIHSQGYSYGPQYSSKKDAIKEVRKWIKEDVVKCRRHFGRAFVRWFKDTHVEVTAGLDPASPMWSRYTIHKV